MDIEHPRENNNILIHRKGNLQGKSFIWFPNNMSYLLMGFLKYLIGIYQMERLTYFPLIFFDAAQVFLRSIINRENFMLT